MSSRGEGMGFYNEIGKYKDQVALIEEHDRVTYGEIEENAQLMGSRMKARSLVFQFCNNKIGSVCGYLGFLYNQMVPILVNSDIDEHLSKSLIELYKPDYIYISDEMKDKFKEFTSVHSAYGYSLLKTNFDYEHQLNEELALLLTTSGSTGSPKLVRQSYTNIQANAESIVEYLEIDENERPITLLPMNYTYGLSIINSHILAGATILLTDKSLMERDLWTFFKEQKATSFGGVPYTYEILKKLRFLNMDLPSLKTMTQAGGKLSVALHKEFAEYAQKQGKRFVVMYGQTEATARMGYLPYDKAIEKCGSMGIAIPGGELTLIDVNDQPINEPDVVGELIYKGKNVTLGYAECAKDLEKGDERNGVLKTGDMAKQDREGFFYIVGRKKRFLKVFGNRVNLDEVERMIKAEFQEIDCACTGRDDLVVLYVTTKDEEMQANIRKYIAHVTNINLAAYQIRSINEIPKNEAGKTLYSKLNNEDK